MRLRQRQIDALWSWQNVTEITILHRRHCRLSLVQRRVHRLSLAPPPRNLHCGGSPEDLPERACERSGVLPNDERAQRRVRDSSEPVHRCASLTHTAPPNEARGGAQAKWAAHWLLDVLRLRHPPSGQAKTRVLRSTPQYCGQ